MLRAKLPFPSEPTRTRDTMPPSPELSGTQQQGPRVDPPCPLPQGQATAAAGGARRPFQLSPGSRLPRAGCRHPRPNPSISRNVPTASPKGQTPAHAHASWGLLSYLKKMIPPVEGSAEATRALSPSLLSHTACFYGHRPRWRCAAAASRRPQGDARRARDRAPGGVLRAARHWPATASRRRGAAGWCWAAGWEWRGAAGAGIAARGICKP